MNAQSNNIKKRNTELAKLMNKMILLGKAEEARRRKRQTTRSAREMKLGADVQKLRDKVNELTEQIGDKLIATYHSVYSYLIQNKIEF